MTRREGSRRKFLVRSVTGLGSVWLATHWPAILRAQPGATFAFFTPEQAAEVEAVAAQIIPTDSTPGAREARCVNFIDRLLVTYEKGQQAAYTKGLQSLQAEVAKVVPGATRFSALTSAQQIQVLTAIEKTPFFTLVRNHTIMGMFASPRHGGNDNQVGWKLLGYDGAGQTGGGFKPPFGYYDSVVS